eukprot:802065-Amorphochlora_amoeboformis.AAC.1
MMAERSLQAETSDSGEWENDKNLPEKGVRAGFGTAFYGVVGSVLSEARCEAALVLFKPVLEPDPRINICESASLRLLDAIEDNNHHEVEPIYAY